ncbi:hypothetical protein AaE_007474 [Aphanomyces astaci]|uniref:Uncharacterized protein n=1 Tax=Aphanomyces astaci TaxID=112090 RepID=A0A6A5AA32_APHAT|nr:hypothetical protein AaE_007474 [Aphanomyces astaci]
MDPSTLVRVLAVWLHRRRMQRDARIKALAYHIFAYINKSPKRMSILKGTLWVDEVLSGNPNNCMETFRMPRTTFDKLVSATVRHGGLRRTVNVSNQEQVAMLLYFAGHHATSREMQCRFQRSGETITRHLRSVMAAMRRMCQLYIKMPSTTSPVHPNILHSRKFFPFFSNCRMAMDGTHIPVAVPSSMVARFQSRKGVTMNVLAACDFDLKFTFVLAGWEGTAGDGKMFEAAKRLGIEATGDQFDLMDAGFALTKHCLTPYRGTRYHLKEYGRGSRRPQTKEEIFNLRHAQLRNVIERIFGILKKRFPVLVYPVEYDFAFQVDMVLVLCMLHNFIRIHGDNDYFDAAPDEAAADDEAQRNDRVEDAVPDEPESNEAKLWRDSIASAIWSQYQTTLRNRRRQRQIN